MVAMKPINHVRRAPFYAFRVPHDDVFIDMTARFVREARLVGRLVPHFFTIVQVVCEA